MLRVKFEMPPKLVRVVGYRAWYILEEVVAIPKRTMHVILQIRRSIVSVTAVFFLRHPPGLIGRQSLRCRNNPGWPFVRQKVAMIWSSIPMDLGSASYDAFHTLVSGRIRGYPAAGYRSAERFDRHAV